MSEICPKCGLPKELCVCDILERETFKKIKVHVGEEEVPKIYDNSRRLSWRRA